MACGGKGVHSQRCLDLRVLKVEHSSLLCKHILSSAPEILLLLAFKRRTEVFIVCCGCPMSYFCLSMSSWFLSHSAHLGLHLGDFFLVRDSFFHFVREEMGPRRELGIVLWGGGVPGKIG